MSTTTSESASLPSLGGAGFPPPPPPAAAGHLMRSPSVASSSGNNNNNNTTADLRMIYLRYGGGGGGTTHHPQPTLREAWLYRDNTVAQLKHAVRTAFHVPSAQALELRCGETSLSCGTHNQRLVTDLLPPHAVVDVIPAGLKTSSGKKKSPRVVQWTKRAWRRRRSGTDSNNSHNGSDSNNSLSSTPPSAAAAARMLITSHHRSVSLGSTERDGSMRSGNSYYQQQHQQQQASPSARNDASTASSTGGTAPPPVMPVSDRTLGSVSDEYRPREDVEEEDEDTTALSDDVKPPPSPQTRQRQQHHGDGNNYHNHNSSNNIPDAFLCPILLTLMADPVTAEDGVTYDRPAIEGHFARLRQEALELRQQRRRRQSQERSHHHHHPNSDDPHDDDDDDDDDSDDDDSINQAHAAHLSTVLWSPLTREVISDRLVPNRSIEHMIVEAVEEGGGDGRVCCETDRRDWQERRRAKVRADRFRRSSCGGGGRALSSAALPEETTQPPPAEEEQEQPPSDAGFPVTTLRNLVRCDRTEEDRMGLYDSGLSVVVMTVGDTDTTTTTTRATTADDDDHPALSYCAVGCCVTPLSSSSSSSHDGDIRRWCHRCQRAVCRDCRRTRVTEIRTGQSYDKSYEICVECVWQIADALMQQQRQRDGDDVVLRETLLTQHVIPRVRDSWRRVVEWERERLRREVRAETDCEALRRDIRAVLRRHLDDDDDDAAKRDSSSSSARWEDPECALPSSLRSSSSGESSDVPHPLEALGNYQTTPHALPLYLSFPSQAMLHVLELMQRQRTALVRELRPLLTSQAHHEQERLQRLYQEYRHVETNFWNGQRQDDLVRLSEKFRQDEMEPEESTTTTTHAREVSLTLLDELSRKLEVEICQFVPNPEKTALNGSVMLRMCPYCRAGPYETIPTNGCANCSGGGGGGGSDDATEPWPKWDEIPGPH